MLVELAKLLLLERSRERGWPHADRGTTVLDALLGGRSSFEELRYASLIRALIGASGCHHDVNPCVDTVNGTILKLHPGRLLDLTCQHYPQFLRCACCLAMLSMFCSLNSITKPSA